MPSANATATSEENHVNQDYWFDMTETNGNKELVTYAMGGFEIDRRESDTKSWTELMTEALPLIQADVDKFGVIQ